MNAQEATLNIAVNLGRLCRFASEGKINRVKTFLEDTDQYMTILSDAKMNPRFSKTYKRFLSVYKQLKNSNDYSYDWADTALTWANILQHRAKLA